MEIENIGIGVLKNSSKDCTIFSASNNNEVSTKIKGEIIESYNHLNLEYVEKFQEKFLIEETPYFIDVSEINDEHNFSELKSLLTEPDFFSKTTTEQIEIVPDFYKKLEKRTEKVSLFIVETTDEILFLAIANRAVIRNKKYTNFSIGTRPNVVEINYGVQIPTKITGVLDKESKKLYVLNVLDFERMIGVSQAKFEKANVTVSNFISGDFKLGAEQWKVEFENRKKLKELLYKQPRNINRLSSYKDGQANYDIEKIQKAVKNLQADKRMEFMDKKVVVNDKSFNTFTAILYDAIIQRVLSGDYDIV